MFQRKADQTKPRLRVFYGDGGLEPSERAAYLEPAPDLLNESHGCPHRVAVSAGEVFELLQDAISTNRAWLQDFADDTIEVPQDLYEVLVAYRRLVYRKAG